MNHLFPYLVFHSLHQHTHHLTAYFCVHSTYSHITPFSDLLFPIPTCSHSLYFPLLFFLPTACLPSQPLISLLLKPVSELQCHLFGALGHGSRPKGTSSCFWRSVGSPPLTCSWRRMRKGGCYQWYGPFFRWYMEVSGSILFHVY